MILGSTYYSLGNLKQAIKHHQESAKFALKYLTDNSFKNKNHFFYRLKRLELGSVGNISICLIDLGETNKARQNLEDCFFNIQPLISEAKKDFLNYSLKIYLMLSFLRALYGFRNEAYEMVEKAETDLPLMKKRKWIQGYGLFFLGSTYKYLGEFTKSFEMFNRVIFYAQEINYPQVKGKALIGLAELYRLQSDFETAFSHHKESIETLDKIGAKGDLAEAYYQLALTYQAMGEPDQSQEYFAKAIQLYEEMEAPKQVEKVRRAIPPSPPTLPGRQSL